MAELSLAPARERTLTAGDHKGHVFREQQANFSLGQAAYAICYKACVDKAHAPNVAPIEGYIGMPRPTSCNWYHSGFLFITLNGKDIGTTPLSSMMVAERGERAILDMVWRHEIANVRVRFLGLPDHDNLYCEIAVEPKQELKSLAVKLRCYPSYFTSWNKRDGARRIQTPATLVEQGQSVKLPAKENWWAVHYDEIFDVAKGEGEGPCAMLLFPNEPSEISFSPGSYAVGTTIAYPPETRRIHLAFWDFKGKTNTEALARLEEGAEGIREELAKLDFTPAAVKGFDVEGIHAAVKRAMKSEVVRATLGDRIEEIQEWLDKYALSLEEGVEGGGIEGEEKLLQSIDRYYSFMWEVKLAELVSEL